MNIEKVLKIIGLKDKEARVYFASLQLGQDTAYNIALKSGLKRPTVYFILERLLEKGFVSVKRTPKAAYFTAISPFKLLLKIDKQKDALEKALPELDQFYRAQSHKPNVQVYEGKEGIELIYYEMAENVRKGKEVIYFGSTAHFLSEYKPFLDIWIKEMKNKSAHARELLVKEELEGYDYLDKIRENNNPNHQIRFFPPGVKFTENDNIIFGNKLAIFSLKKEVFVILIESENITESYRNMFEIAWKVSKPAY